MVVVTDWDKIPAWIQDGLRTDAEGSVDGIRWVTNGHIAFPVSNGTWSVLPGPVGDLLSAVRRAMPRTRLGPYIVEAHLDGALPPYIEGEPLRGAAAYAVTWLEHDLSCALYYMAAIHCMFGPVSWWGSGSIDPIVAKVGEEVAAVVMPVRRGQQSFAIGSP
jgi:hypothetical protein